jgi:hypothetical protein
LPETRVGGSLGKKKVALSSQTLSRRSMSLVPTALKNFPTAASAPSLLGACWPKRAAGNAKSKRNVSVERPMCLAIQGSLNRPGKSCFGLGLRNPVGYWSPTFQSEPAAWLLFGCRNDSMRFARLCASGFGMPSERLTVYLF